MDTVLRRHEVSPPFAARMGRRGAAFLGWSCPGGSPPTPSVGTYWCGPLNGSATQANHTGLDWATPYTGRRMYLSPMIHAGVSPIVVAAAVGHTSGETIWKHYARTVDGVRSAKPAPMQVGIRTARAALAGNGVPAVCPQGGAIELFPDRSADEMAAQWRDGQARAAGLGPATFGSGG
jgi:hypothetical protein